MELQQIQQRGYSNYQQIPVAGKQEMTVVITKVGPNLYDAKYTPYKSDKTWSTQTPLDAKALIKVLVEQGCHPRDIWDELKEKDPEATW